MKVASFVIEPDDDDDDLGELTFVGSQGQRLSVTITSLMAESLARALGLFADGY